MAESMSIRMSGTEAGVRAVVSALRGMREVDELVEVGMDAPLEGDDSSSAGLQDAASYAQELELGVPDSVAYDHVHRRIEALASGADVVVEWLTEE